MDQFIGNFELLLEFPLVNLKIIIDGVMIGALFALAAYGLALVWGVMNVKNLAQGDFVIGGGYVSWWLVQQGVHPLLGVPAAFVIMALLGGALSGTFIHTWCRSHLKLIIGLSCVAGLFFIFGIYFEEEKTFIFGLTGDFLAAVSGIALTILLIINGGIYNLIISRVIERDLFTSLLATFGLAIMMAQIMNLLFGSDTQSVDLGYDTLYFADGLIDIPIAKLIGVCMAAVLAAGAIIVMVWVIQPFYGIAYSIRAFVIVTAAGLGNLPGVIAAGLGIGALEQYGAHIFGIGYQQAIAVVLLLIVLLIRLFQQMRNRQVLK